VKTATADPRKFPFPPAIPAAALLASWGLARAAPIDVPWPVWTRPVGWILFTLPWLFAIWAVATFRHHQTAVNPRGVVTAIVSGGPYRYSRNPMYVTLMAIYVGGALAFHLAWAFVLLVPLFLALQFGVIVPEERHLAVKFGDEFGRYATRVRRWL